MDPGGLGEEFGWRGFALARLLRRTSPIAASLVLGLIWGVWHLPAFLIPALPQSQLSFPLFLAGATALTTIMTWLHLRSQGSLLVAIATHLTVNHVSEITGVAFGTVQVVIIVLAVLLVVTGQLAPKRVPAVAVAPGKVAA